MFKIKLLIYWFTYSVYSYYSNFQKYPFRVCFNKNFYNFYWFVLKNTPKSPIPIWEWQSELWSIKLFESVIFSLSLKIFPFSVVRKENEMQNFRIHSMLWVPLPFIYNERFIIFKCISLTKVKVGLKWSYIKVILNTDEVKLYE